jgi:peptidyl-prolyl cis-trans isomerase D
MAEKPKASLKTIVARVLVGLMFSMLIVSFAIWGIGPIFRQGLGARFVAEVGPVRISPQAFQEQYRRELRRLQNLFQTNIDAERARELGLPQRVVQDMVARILFELAARDAGIAVGDDLVRQSIFDNPSFRDAQGKFDRRVFENLLYNAGLSEDRYVQLTRDDMVRGQLTDAIVAGGIVPPELVDQLYRYRYERRVADTLLVSAASVTDIPTPSEAELKAYHKAHAAEFTAPEYRTVTAVELRPSDIAATIKVPADKIKEEYDARAGEFKVPEERTLRQILVKDEDTAKRAEAALSEGKTFDKVAQDITGKPPQDLGTVRESDLGSDALMKAAFELNEGAVTAPIQTPLGWHIVQAVKIVPGHNQSLAEVKDKLAHDIALRQAGEAVFDLGNKLQDALGGGASLEEAAQKLGLKLVKTAPIDRKGDGKDGKPMAGLPDGAKFLETAFGAETGRESDLVDDGNGGYFVLRVDKVDPSALKPLAEVKDKVIAGWQAEARRKEAEKRAQALLGKAKGGTSLAELAKEADGTVATTKPFTRTGEGAGEKLPPELVAALFQAKPGEVVSAPAPDGAIVARLDDIKPADPKADGADFNKLRDQLQGAVDGDLLNAFGEALRARYGVEINEDVLNSLVGS